MGEGKESRGRKCHSHSKILLLAGRQADKVLELQGVQPFLMLQCSLDQHFQFTVHSITYEVIP